MTDKDLGTAAGDIFAESFIRDTLSGLANVLGVKIDVPDAMIANLGAVLQAQIDLLAELQSTGRLLGDDEMRLTAEEVEDVKIVLGQLERGGPAFEAAHERLRALFPATEPAEEFSCTWGTVGCTCDGPLGDVAQKAANAAPAVPAEEEAKAEEFCCHQKCRFTDWGGINRKHERGADCPTVPKPASSPVVPAPTETGLWPSLLAVPVTVQKVKDAKGYEWHRRGSTDGWRGCNGADAYTSNCRTGHRDSAPFIAAKEG